MGHRGKSYGGSIGIGTSTLMIFGTVFGMVADAFWYSLGLPGTKTPITNCSILTDADVIQLMMTGGLTLAGFLMNIKTLPSLTFGIMAGMLIPKVIMPYFHLPRYGLFDYNPETGSITKAAALKH